MEKHYDFKAREKYWLNYWEKNKTYSFNKKSNKKIFSIDTPPPTVSGDMHLGHSFSYSHIDFIARYKRMQGFNLFFPFGTDDNGLATEKLVGKLNNVRSKDMDREKFINLCLKTLKKIRPDFVHDWKKLGFSSDYNLFYTTIDNHSRAISQWSFIDLYNKKRIYRKEAPTIFCPHCQTAIAQVELEDKELESYFSDIIFKLDNRKNLIIATTRPELLPACNAIFAHPDDKRYKKLFGKKAKVPLFNHKVKIMPDKRVNPEKGTGIVMSCSFGDLTDMEWYLGYNLELRMAIAKDGRMTKLAGKYKGMKIKEARKAIIEDLKKKKLLIKQKKIKHFVNVHERCHTEVEILQTKQWFIKYLDLKKNFLKAGKKLNWYPKFMKVRYDHWIKGLQWDWCISRQRHFGVPFPVWYCNKCNETILADLKDLPVDPLKNKPKKCKCGSTSLIPETDVLDTWATSSLTPKIAIDLIKEQKIKNKLFPMSLRANAHDIITFWLFNTVVKAQLHTQKNPWKDVTISGFVLDPKGKKMSKSKGNIIKPQDVMEKYGADALRFWAAGSKLGEDLPFMEKDLTTGKKTVTKLWNASKFVLMNLKDFKSYKGKLEILDKWILIKLNKVIQNCTKNFDNYEYSKAKLEIENFFWNVYADYYIEIVKDRLYNDKGKKTKSGKHTLYVTLLDILRMFSPIMPFITEEIYHTRFSKDEKIKSIHNSPWPRYNKKLENKDIEKIGDRVVEIITLVRKFKSKRNLSLKHEIYLTLSKKDVNLLNDVLEDLAAVTKAKEIYEGKFKISL